MTGIDSTVVPEAVRVKELALHRILRDLRSVIVAFSGGTDSAYLAFAAAHILGERALAMTADSPSYPETHRQLARRVASEFRLAHEFIQTSEIEQPDYRSNPANRCYFCKKELYTHLTALAQDRGFAVVIDGSNADDRGDYRPGRQAAREYGVRSPLDEADLTKAEIRLLSRAAGLPTWDVPASACLSSRIPYGDEVTEQKLRMIEQAESILAALGFRVYRVRHHGPVARIELGSDEIPRAFEPATRHRIVEGLTRLGYRYVTIDLQGYRVGSLNDALRLTPVP